MKKIRKFCLILFSLVLVYQSTVLPAFASFNTEQGETTATKATILTSDDESEVPIFVESSTSSDVLLLLENGSNVEVIKEFESFSLVEYTDSETNDAIQGYIENHNLSTLNVTEPIVTNATIITLADQTEVPVLEDISDSSTVLYHLSNEDEVEILESSGDFSLILYFDEGADELIKGFVNNQNLITIEDNNQNELIDEEQLDIEDENEQHLEIDNQPNEENKPDDTSIDDSVNEKDKIKQPVDSEATVNNDEDENVDDIVSDLETSKEAKATYSSRLNNQSRTTHKGFALKSPTHVYASQSTQSNKLKSYTQGSVLKYSSLNSQWYEATVLVQGKWTTGYIHVNDVEDLPSVQTTYKGIALKNKTNVYQKASTESSILKSYDQGTILKYKSLTSEWYEATVYINGKWTTGYIHINDVENLPEVQTTYKGIALKNKTNVYQKTSTDSKVLKSYAQGSILQYRDHSENWYIANVWVDGVKKTGYIHKSHVENSNEGSNILKGIALKSPTRVYSRASTSSSTLKSYSDGSILQYREYSSDWYVANVWVNGVKKTGYIHKSHVENSNEGSNILKGIALKSPTRVYSRASTSSSTLKSYSDGSILQYREYSSDWYIATVWVNGVKKTGYIHKSHVEKINDIQERLEGWALKSPTNVYSKTSRSSSVLKSYPRNRLLKFKTFSNSWYEATVYINGKTYTGYIHKNDISFGSSTTNYNLSLTEAVNIQMKVNPQTDKKYAYVSKAYINSSNKVTAGSLNVRVGPGAGYAAIGQLSNGTSVTILGEYNGWYQIAYNHNTWVTASPMDVRYYLDPNNFINDPRQQFQFLNLAKPSAIDAAQLNSFLADKGILKGQGQAFIDASNKVGVNDVYLVSHALLETGHGTSNLATGVEVGINNNGSLELVTSSNRNKLRNIKTTYNMYGIGAVDSNPLRGGAFHAYRQDWTTPYKAIVGGASFIGVNYVQSGQNTLYKMRWNPTAMSSSRKATHQYATDIGWASKQVNTMYNLYQQLGITNIILDIPVYKN